jgi:hypothetical protein
MALCGTPLRIVRNTRSSVAPEARDTARSGAPHARVGCALGEYLESNAIA